MAWHARALLMVVVLVTGGCGYSLAGRGSTLPEHIRTIGIPQVENRSTSFRVEQALTEKLRTEFIGRGRYKVLSDAGGADAVLSGEITSIAAEPIGFSDQQLASRYLFTLGLRMQFTDARTNTVIWEDGALTFRGEYDLTTRSSAALDAAVFMDQERSTVDRIATDVARTVVTAIMEAF